jgi:hypothetical protein
LSKKKSFANYFFSNAKFISDGSDERFNHYMIAQRNSRNKYRSFCHFTAKKQQEKKEAASDEAAS